MEKHEIVSLIIEVTADQRSKLFALREVATMAFFSSLHSLDKDDTNKVFSITKERLQGIINDQLPRMIDFKEDRINYNLAKYLKEEAESFLETMQKWEEQKKKVLAASEKQAAQDLALPQLYNYPTPDDNDFLP